jgi:hypothetical protein
VTRRQEKISEEARRVGMRRLPIDRGKAQGGKIFVHSHVLCENLGAMSRLIAISGKKIRRPVSNIRSSVDRVPLYRR